MCTRRPRYCDFHDVVIHETLANEDEGLLGTDKYKKAKSLLLKAQTKAGQDIVMGNKGERCLSLKDNSYIKNLGLIAEDESNESIQNACNALTVDTPPTQTFLWDMNETPVSRKIKLFILHDYVLEFNPSNQKITLAKSNDTDPVVNSYQEWILENNRIKLFNPHNPDLKIKF